MIVVYERGDNHPLHISSDAICDPQKTSWTDLGSHLFGETKSVTSINWEETRQHKEYCKICLHSRNPYVKIREFDNQEDTTKKVGHTRRYVVFWCSVLSHIFSIMN